MSERALLFDPPVTISHIYISDWGRKYAISFLLFLRLCFRLLSCFSVCLFVFPFIKWATKYIILYTLISSYCLCSFYFSVCLSVLKIKSTLLVHDVWLCPSVLLLCLLVRTRSVFLIVHVCVCLGRSLVISVSVRVSRVF